MTEPRPRVLVVEDELGVRRVIEKILVRAGYIAESAVTGSEALDKLKDGRFQAVILDLALPWLTGFDVLATLKDDPATADLPVVIITGSAVTDAQFERYRRVALVRKPFEPAALIERLESVL
jgi:CheY-like chemotaxis protein